MRSADPEGLHPDDFVRGSCGCGYDLIYTPDGWQHTVAPWFWGDDHEPQAAAEDVKAARRWTVKYCQHRPDDSPRTGDWCKDCEVRLTWIGPSLSTDWEPVANWEQEEFE